MMLLSMLKTFVNLNINIQTVPVVVIQEDVTCNLINSFRIKNYGGWILSCNLCG